MFGETSRCIEPSLYDSVGSDSTFEERRCILLAKYAEAELDSGLEDLIREHLNRCGCCTEYFKKWEGVQESEELTMHEAHCPSSMNLDRYVFSRHELSPTEKQKIEQHLQDCPLCKGETSWLGSVETVPVAPQRNWLQYASIAAALFFLVLSIFWFVDRTSLKRTGEQLQAAAVIKTPDQIDYVSLNETSIPLPQKMEGVYQEGIRSLKDGKFQESIRHLELVATAHPDHSGSIFLLGYAYYRMNEPQKAFEMCDRAETMAPKSLERCLSLVNIALKTGHYGRAIREISGLYHMAPNHPGVKETYDRVMTITQGRSLKL